MNARVLAAPLALLAVGALWLLVRSTAHERGAVEAPGPAAKAGASESSALESAGPDTGAEARTATSAPGETRGGAAEPATLRAEEAAGETTLAVTGRCVCDGRPVEGVALAITIADTRRKRAQERVDGLSDALGRFRIEVPSYPGCELLFRGERAGHASRFASLGPPPDGAEMALGDLQFPRGATIVGRVTDSRGDPVVHARILLATDTEFPIDLPYDRLGMAGRPSDEHGEYAFQLPACIWHATVSGIGLVGAVEATIDATAGGEVRHDFVVDRVGTIEGRLVLPDGSPAIDARVEAYAPGTAETAAWSAPVDAQGAFVLRAKPGVPAEIVAAPVELGLESHVRYEAEPVLARFGDRGVIFPVRERRSLVLRLVDAGDGSTVLGCAVRLADEPSFAGRFERADEAGRIALVGAGEDPSWVVVLPPEPYAERGPVRVDDAPLAADGAVVLALEPAATLAVTLLEESGAPVEGARVELVGAPVGLPIAAFTMVGDPRQASIFGGILKVWRLRERTSDAEGRASLPLPDLADTALHLLITAPDGRQAARTLAGESAVEVELPEGIPVRIRLLGTWPELAHLQLFHADPAPCEPVPRARGFKVDPALEPRLLLPAEGVWLPVIGLRGELYPLATASATARRGGELILELDADRLLWPPADVRLRRSGAALETGELTLELRPDPGAPTATTTSAPRCIVPIEDGVAHLPILPAGIYRATASEGDAEGFLDAAVRASGTLELP